MKKIDSSKGSKKNRHCRLFSSEALLQLLLGKKEMAFLLAELGLFAPFSLCITIVF